MGKHFQLEGTPGDSEKAYDKITNLKYEKLREKDLIKFDTHYLNIGRISYLLHKDGAVIVLGSTNVTSKIIGFHEKQVDKAESTLVKLSRELNLPGIKH